MNLGRNRKQPITTEIAAAISTAEQLSGDKRTTANTGS